jgi:hypothetical protein
MIALSSVVVRASAFVALVALASACFVRSESSGSGGSTGGSTGSAPDPSSGTVGGTDTPPSATSPILVAIDNDKTMAAAPGDGVGIFTEYGSGGRWHVWWTCDTARTAQPCTFDLQIVAQGSAKIENLAPEGLLATDTAELTDSQTLRTHAYTTTGVGGVKFETLPGTVVQIEAKVGGVSDPSFFFFVQDGKVNGGYGGKLTNPLRFQGTAP